MFYVYVLVSLSTAHLLFLRDYQVNVFCLSVFHALTTFDVVVLNNCIYLSLISKRLFLICTINYKCKDPLATLKIVGIVSPYGILRII